jgi:hypothetical protein
MPFFEHKALQADTPTPPVKRPYLRILMIAFVPCFLWPPLTICLQKLLDFSNTTVWILSLFPIGLTSWLLSRGRLFSSKHRATRALVLPVALAFLWFAFLVWFLLISKNLVEFFQPRVWPVPVARPDGKERLRHRIFRRSACQSADSQHSSAAVQTWQVGR